MNRVLALIITLGVLIVLAFSCLFVVDQRQYAVVFALGEIKRVINEPGLYMKLTYDSDEIDRFITAEKINIQVDSFVKWRIADPRQFFVSVGHSPLAADDRIGRQLRSALNNEIARLSVADVISSARETLVKQVMKVMSVELEKIGVTIVDVRLKRVDFAPEVAERVYERMRSERTRVANERRAKGAAEGERIRADADRQRGCRGQPPLRQGLRSQPRVRQLLSQSGSLSRFVCRPLRHAGSGSAVRLLPLLPGGRAGAGRLGSSAHAALQDRTRSPGCGGRRALSPKENAPDRCPDEKCR